jgi:hypothetical protein
MTEIYYHMLKKQMKSSKIKTIVVECKLKDSLDIKEYDVDAEIFDDIYLEAATRFAEQHVKKQNVKIAPILTAYEKKDEKDFDKHYCYNSYYIIINAGFYKKAEIMRKNFLMVVGIDLQKESLKSKDAKSNSNE